MTEPMKLVVTGKQSIRFAEIHWKDKDGSVKVANICDVCDGGPRAPKAVQRFAETWVNAFTA